MKAIEKLFSPEFRNRLDSVIQFKPLDFEVIGQVVDKFMFELETQLAERGVFLVLEPEARAWLAERGYDPQMGARPMARVIQENIKKPLPKNCCSGAWPAAGGCGYTWTTTRWRLRSKPAKSAPFRRSGAELLEAESDAAFGEVVRRHFDLDAVPVEDADIVFAHFAGNVGRNDVAVVQFDAESGVGKGFDNLALHFDDVFFRHKAVWFHRVKTPRTIPQCA